MIDDRAKMVLIRDLTPWAKNPRKNDPAVDAVAESIQRFGFASPILARLADGRVIAGHTRLKAAVKLGMTEVPVRYLDLDDESANALALADNKLGELAEWDDTALAEILSGLGDGAKGLGWNDDEIAQIIANTKPEPNPNGQDYRGSLADRFGVPPFSVLDARQGYWQQRKKSWLAMGIRSELGRGSDTGDRTTFVAGSRSQDELDPVSKKILSTIKRGEDDSAPGTSIFDPVLCELVYRWFSPEGGTILDPFAGGSVRGIVAAKLGRQYVGIDIRSEQIAANEIQRQILSDTNPAPVWYCGDSMNIATIAPDLKSDLVFSCPPYGDLEKYSENPRGLSAMTHSAFIASYRTIIAAAVSTLKPNRFAVFVVGDFRDKHGFYRNFVSDTITAFEDAGAKLYNEAILVTSVGSLPLRTARAFNAGRKLGKTHQNILVFFKGDPTSIHDVLGDCDFSVTEDSTGDIDAT